MDGLHLLEGLREFKRDESLKVLNISLRMWNRIKAKQKAVCLDSSRSARVWAFAEVLSTATALLGSQLQAERWLAASAIGLDSHRPINLMTTPQGAALVKTILERLAQGVYA